MTNIRMTVFVAVIGLSICTALPFSTFAQTYPVRPIRIIVGFSAGGGADQSARLIAKELSESMGQSVIVDNRPGASGNIGADIVAKSVPDGYTLLLADVGIAMPSLFVNLPYDVNKDLVPVSMTAMAPSVLVAHPSLPANNIKELIALAKAKPGKINYGSSGVGSISHMMMEILIAETGIQMVHVPYKGTGPAAIGLMSGEVDLYITAIPGVLPQIKAGKIKALGFGLQKRDPSLPNVPTVHESGLPGYNAASWVGLYAPAGIPKNTLRMMSQEIMKIMRVQGLKDKFVRVGLESVGNSPEEFSAFIDEEILKWEEIIKMAGVKLQ